MPIGCQGHSVACDWSLLLLKKLESEVERLGKEKKSVQEENSRLNRQLTTLGNGFQRLTG